MPRIILHLALPLSNALLVLGLFLLLPQLLRSRLHTSKRLLVAGASVAGGIAVYHLAASLPAAERWLARLNSPLIVVLLVIVMPALYLPRNRGYKVFLLLPVAFLGMLGWAIYTGWQSIPAAAPVTPWLLVRPAWLMAGTAAALVLMQPVLSLTAFRRLVRASFFLILVYGGFALRQDYNDYQSMLGRRTQNRDVMTLSETAPVVRDADRLLFLPGAVCRFAPDGGYVQGCNLEMFQRLLQTDFGLVAAGDPAAMNTLAVVLAAMVLFFALSLVAGRWGCGWLCPLSTMGDLLNWIRQRLGLPVLRPSRRLKQTAFFGGLSLLGVTMAMARAYPHLDADGRFAGCKIPIYPFCKICPNLQFCPVAGAGLAAYPPLPGTEWAFGFFRYGTIVVALLFVISFMAARRLWCRFCPIGMVSGLFNRGGMLTLRKRAQKCNRCGVCTESCPMDITEIRDELLDSNVSNYHCVLCLRCIETCPRSQCLSLEHNGTTITSSRWPIYD